ncbi:unnamed protein product, partial [Musa acuminata subsp. burmannicoides]
MIPGIQGDDHPGTKNGKSKAKKPCFWSFSCKIKVFFKLLCRALHKKLCPCRQRHEYASRSDQRGRKQGNFGWFSGLKR